MSVIKLLFMAVLIMGTTYKASSFTELNEDGISKNSVSTMPCCTSTAPSENTPTQSWTSRIITSTYGYLSSFLSGRWRHQSSFDHQMEKDFIMVPVSSKSLANMHEASTLLVSCIDFRLRDETDKLMKDIFKLTDKYDEVAIPGAALAMVQPAESDYSHWSATLENVILLARRLHKIERVIFLDHRGCGAYKIIKGEESIKTPEIETATHQEVFAEARKALQENFLDLKVYTLLMGLDGKVEIFK